MNSCLHVLTSLCNKVHVQYHSKFIVLEEEKLFYVRDTIKNQSKTCLLGKDWKKVYLLCYS